MHAFKSNMFIIIIHTHTHTHTHTITYDSSLIVNDLNIMILHTNHKIDSIHKHVVDHCSLGNQY